MKDSVARYRWVILGIALLSQCAGSSVLQVFSPLAPLLQSDLGLSRAEVGVLASATSTGVWSVMLAGGFLADRFGIRAVMSMSLVVTGSLMLAMGWTSTLLQAAVIMYALGLSRGGVFPASTKAILDWFPPRGRATAMGIKQMGLPLAGVLAAPTLPALGLWLGWRAAVAVPGVLIILVGVLDALLYRDAPQSGRTKARAPSLGLAIREFVRNRGLWAICSIAFCFLVVQLALLTYMALYLKDVVLVSAVPDESLRIVAAGGYLAVCQVGGAFGRVFWGVVSDRGFHGRRAVVLVIVGAIMTVTSVMVAAMGSDLPLWLVTVVVFAYGATGVGWNGVYGAVIVETVGRKFAATGVGLSMTLTEVGSVAGPPLFGLIADLADSYQTAWLFLAGVAAMGTLAAVETARRERLQETAR